MAKRRQKTRDIEEITATSDLPAPGTMDGWPEMHRTTPEELSYDYASVEIPVAEPVPMTNEDWCEALAPNAGMLCRKHERPLRMQKTTLPSGDEVEVLWCDGCGTPAP